MSQNTVNTHVLEIKKNEGLTHALKRYVEQDPNSIMSDGEITLSEWNATIDKLTEINNKRKAENKTLLFRNGNDKSDYHTNYTVYDTDSIELTNEEMNKLYKAMGVSLKQTSKAEANAVKQNQSAAQNNPQQTAQTNSAKQNQQTKQTQQPNKTAKSRYSLSWGEIGKQALKSTGNFFKGMFCDEKGFSLKRTAATVGIIGGTAVLAAVSAPAALVVGAGLGLYMAYEGGKKLIKGTNEYYKATTHEEAQAAMEKAMDGGVETTMGVAALFGVKKGFSSMKQAKVTYNEPAAEPVILESTPKPVAEPVAEPVIIESTPKPVTELISEPTVRQNNFINEANPDYELWLRKQSTMEKHAAKKTEASNARNENWLNEQHNKTEQEYSDWWNKELPKSEAPKQTTKSKVKKEAPVRKKVTQEEIDKTRAEKAEIENNTTDLAAKKTKAERKISQEVKKHNKANKKANNESHQIQNNAKIEKAKQTEPKTKDLDTQISEEIKGIEGSIKSLKRKIDGAKRFGKDTKKLESELANLEKKLAQRKLDKEVPFLY